MKEKTLLKIALAVSITGVVILFLLSQQISTDEAMIQRLDEMVDEQVIITGQVIGVNEQDSATFIILQKQETVTITLFGKTPPLEIGDLVQVRGRVTEHDNKVGLIGDEIRVI